MNEDTREIQLNESPQDIGSEVIERKQESSAPVKDFVAPKAEKPFHFFGQVTGKSTITDPDLAKVPSEDQQKPTVERSLFLRHVRANLLKEFKRIPKSNREGRRQVLEKAHERDRLAKEFLNQGEIRVNLPHLGEQMARYSILNAEKSEGMVDRKPPIYIIPGISNELDSPEGHAQTVASREENKGRKVVVLGYPEGYVGSITQEFADKVTSSENFSSHGSFFVGAVGALSEKDPEIELWGLSTGAPIVANMLSDPEFQNKVARAVLISPFGSVEQSPMWTRAGIVADSFSYVGKRFTDLVSNSVFFTDKKGGADATQKARRKKVFGSLIRAGSHKSPDWATMRVKDGGNITVIAGGRDFVTKSYAAADTFRLNPQVDFTVVPNESHISSFNSPKVLDTIQQMQDS